MKPLKGLQGIKWKDLPDDRLEAVMAGLHQDLLGVVRTVRPDGPCTIPYPFPVIRAALLGIELEKASRGTAPPPRRVKLTRLPG